MDDLIQISKINDFIFCPYSIYLHSVYEDFSPTIYRRTYQVVGKMAHEPIDQKRYTTSKSVLQGIDVYCEKYGLIGKIDTFDYKSGALVERKYKIKNIFDGQKFQLYAQMFCLDEMEYRVKSLFLHSLSDNKRYSIPLPDGKEIEKFEELLTKVRNYTPFLPSRINEQKCSQCIYKPLCH